MKKLLTFIAVAVLGLGAFTETSHAQPTLITPGPTVGGCPTSVLATVIQPVTLTTPLELAIGAGAGTETNRCTTLHDEIIVSARLWLVPLFGPETLVGAMSSSANCAGQCNYANALGAGTMPPGIYRVTGYVLFKDGGVFSSVTTFQGRQFLYTGRDILPM